MSASLPRARFIAAATAFASINVVPRPARAATFNYKAGHDTPLDHPETLRAKQMWDQVRKETGGQLNVQVFPAGQLGSDPAMLSQVRSGALEFYMASGGILGSVVPLAAIEGVAFAFRAPKDAWQAYAGPLGGYIRKDIESKGLTALDGVWEVGMRQVTSASKPIRTADDLQGFKIRTPAGAIWVDLFKTLGASPTTIDISGVYVALQTHIVDGQENPVALIETWRFYEVQKYLNLTNHMWGGKWYVANPQAFGALPPDIQRIVRRNNVKYSGLQRADVQKLNDTLQSTLVRQGMTVVQPEIETFRSKLGPYYAKWKGEFGATAWALLEDRVGKLG